VPNQRVVAVLGRGLVPADTPILCADDLGPMRGDGVFETMHVRAGTTWLLDEHLARMARSAQLTQLSLPPSAALAELVATAVAAWPASDEGALRLVCTRGREDVPDGPATVFASVSAIPDLVLQARRDGIAVVTASLGTPAVTAVTPEASPWLLRGAKTLSYAINMASQRWAASTGADDVLWVSSDGYALEAPTSSLVWLVRGVLGTVPADPTGILPGITARYLLDHASSLGVDVAERMISLPELAGVDGAWFTSSVRGLAALRSLDGHPLPAMPEMTERIRTLLGFEVR
jgi:4-amino-4-deoxychorismate lyase